MESVEGDELMQPSLKTERQRETERGTERVRQRETIQEKIQMAYGHSWYDGVQCRMTLPPLFLTFGTHITSSPLPRG